jgi:hypothetical protein
MREHHLREETVEERQQQTAFPLVGDSPVRVQFTNDVMEGFEWNKTTIVGGLSEDCLLMAA